jgi:ankyrin repeat protein
VLALKQLARPTYDVSAVAKLIDKDLYPAKSAKERKALVEAFVKQHGELARAGIEWHLFRELAYQERDEKRIDSKPSSPDLKARVCLIDVFGYPATVASKDRPKTRPLTVGDQAEFVQTLWYDRGEKLDRAVRDLLTKTDDDELAFACMNRLVGRGYDADIEACLPRRPPMFTGRLREKLGWNRLHAAIDRGIPDLIDAELKEVRDVNARGRDGRTALHLAAAAGLSQVVDQLLDAKADPNVKDERGRLAVELAAFADHPDAVRRLVGGGSAVPDVFTAVIVGDAARLGELIKGPGGLAFSRNEPDLTLLYVAVREGNEPAVRALLATRVNVDATGGDRWTPLHLAVLTSHVDIAKLLIEKGANASAKDGRDRTPLHHAAEKGDVEMVKALLVGKPDRSLKDNWGWTALELAQRKKHKAVVELLEDPK